MKKIQELTDALKNKKYNESYLSILSKSEITYQDVETYATWNSDHYTRNCLYQDEAFELLLVCFERNQKGPIHDFGIQNAWVHTIQGKLKEERFQFEPASQRLEKVSSLTLSKEDYSYMNGNVGIHRFSNTYEARSVSLNLYAKPIKKWREYDEFSGVSTEKKIKSNTKPLLS